MNEELRKFPRLTVKSGDSPHGRSAEVLIDGKTPERLHRLEIDVDVSDAINVRLYQFAEIDVDVAIPSTPKAGYIAKVRIPQLDKDQGEVVIKAWRVIAEGRGSTLRDAVRAAASRIPDDGATLGGASRVAGPKRRG